MTDEELEKLKWERDYYKLRFEELNKHWNKIIHKLEKGKEWDGHTEKDVTRLLSLEKLTKNLQKELDKKDKVIDLMANQLSIASDRYEYMEETEIIEYFYKKVSD